MGSSAEKEPEFSGLSPMAIAVIASNLPNGEKRLACGGQSLEWARFPNQFHPDIPSSRAFTPEKYVSEEINQEIREELKAIQDWLEAHPGDMEKAGNAWEVWKWHAVRTRLRDGEVIHILSHRAVLGGPLATPPAVGRAPMDDTYLAAMDVETAALVKAQHHYFELAEKRLNSLLWVSGILAFILAGILFA